MPGLLALRYSKISLSLLFSLTDFDFTRAFNLCHRSLSMKSLLRMGLFHRPHPHHTHRSLMRLRLPPGPSQLDLFDQIHMILPTLQSLGPWQARSLSLSLSVIKVVNQGQVLCCVYSERQAAASCLASLCFSRCLGPLPWRPHHRLPAAGTMPRAVLVTFTQRM